MKTDKSAKNATAASKKTAPASTSTPAPAPKTGEAGSLHKLRVGDVFLKKDVEHVVWYLNDSRASVAPLTSQIKYALRESDGKPQFMLIDAGKGENISPNSEMEVIRSLGREGLAKFIDENKDKHPATEEGMKKKSKNKEKNEPGSGIRAGSLGTYEGFSIASVVRTLATLGWNFAEIRAWLDSRSIKASDQTIKISLYWNRHPERPDHHKFQAAPLPKDKIPAKPKIAAPAKKPAKTAKKVVAKAEKNGAASKTKPKAGAKSAKTPEKKDEKPARASEQIAALKKNKTEATARS